MRYILPLFLLLLVLNACKKSSVETAPVSTTKGAYCTMQSATTRQSTGCSDSISLTNDNQGRLVRTIRHNTCNGGQLIVSKQFYSYHAGKVIILDTSFGTDEQTLTVDATLRILDHRSNNSGFVLQYQYSPQGLLESRVVCLTTKPGCDTTQYVIIDGDLMEAWSRNGNKLIYSYYDKLVPPSGYFTQNGFEFGSAHTFKNKHLLKEIRDEHNNVISSYRYEFDTHGNVTKKVTGRMNGTWVEDSTSYYYSCPVE